MIYKPRTREQLVAVRWQYRFGTITMAALSIAFLILGGRANSSQIEDVFKKNDSNWVDAVGPMFLWIIAAVLGLIAYFLLLEWRACTTSIAKKDEREIRKMRDLSNSFKQPAA